MGFLQRFAASYGYVLDYFDRLWPHMMGRIRKGIDLKAITVIPLNRCGAEVEGSKSPGAQTWRVALGVYTTTNGTSDKTRAVINNHQLMDLLRQLMMAYVLLGNSPCPGGHKWCSMAAAYEYLQYTRKRVCPPHGSWPPLQRCLDSEIEARGAWMPHLRAGKTLSEAISLTTGERSGAWNWATPQLNAAYFNVAKASAADPAADSGGNSSSAHPNPSGVGGGGSSRPRSRSRGSRKATPKGKGKSRGGGKGAGQHPTHTRNGNKFCEAFETGGCVDGTRCPDGGVHACNFLESGKVCGMAGRRRCNHGVDHSRQ